MPQQVRTLVVGSGVAGLGVAWQLRDDPDVLVVDRQSHVGGNVRTVDVHTDDAGTVAVDIGFIVCNPHTYPRLLGLFEQLGIEPAPSDMSLSVRLADGAEWAGSPTGLLGGGRWRRRRSWRRAAGIARLAGRAHALAGSGLRLADARDHLGPVVVDDYLTPMVQAVWSAPHDEAGEMPLDTLVAFFDQHHLFDLARRPTWLTVPGGARRYVEALVSEVSARFEGGMAVTQLDRSPGGWTATLEPVTAGGASESHTVECERVVLATPPDVARRLLAGQGDAAAAAPRDDVLGNFRTTTNRVVLHRDESVMPADRSLWSSWNVRSASGVDVSYWMNRLQPLATSEDVFVTLNPAGALRDVEVAVDMVHPVLDAAAAAAQALLHEVQGADDVWLCGAWTGYGFHEDGLESGLAVGAALAGTASNANAPTPVPGRPATQIVDPHRVVGT